MNHLVGKTLVHPSFRDVCFQVVGVDSNKQDKTAMRVMWFHQRNGLFFGYDTINVSEVQVREFVELEKEEDNG